MPLHRRWLIFLKNVLINLHILANLIVSKIKWCQIERNNRSLQYFLLKVRVKCTVFFCQMIGLHVHTATLFFLC